MIGIMHPTRTSNEPQSRTGLRGIAVWGMDDCPSSHLPAQTPYRAPVRSRTPKGSPHFVPCSASTPVDFPRFSSLVVLAPRGVCRSRKRAWHDGEHQGVRHLQHQPITNCSHWGPSWIGGDAKQPASAGSRNGCCGRCPTVIRPWPPTTHPQSSEAGRSLDEINHVGCGMYGQRMMGKAWPRRDITGHFTS